jgi:hypothetical protein
MQAGMSASDRTAAGSGDVKTRILAGKPFIMS